MPTRIPTYAFIPTVQPTNALARLDVSSTFVTGGLALAVAVMMLAVYFVFGYVHEIGFLRYTRMTRPCARFFMQNYERMNVRVQQKTSRMRAEEQPRSAARAALFLIAALFAVAVAGPVLFVYLTIGVFFQAMLIYRTFWVAFDPLNSKDTLLTCIQLWWDMVIRYIVPTLPNLIGSNRDYSAYTYDTTAIYAPMVTAFRWMVNLNVDFGSALRGVVCVGSFVGPLSLLFDVVVVLVIIIVIEGDYVMLLGPVMNGTYDKYMERMYRDKGYVSKCRYVLSLFLCGLYRVVDLPTQFVNALHFLSTLVATRFFFLAGGGWRDANTQVCDSIVFTRTGVTRASNVDYGMAVVTTVVFYLLAFLSFVVGSNVIYSQLFTRPADSNDGAGAGGFGGPSPVSVQPGPGGPASPGATGGAHPYGDDPFTRELFASPVSRGDSAHHLETGSAGQATMASGGGRAPASAEGRRSTGMKSVAFSDGGGPGSAQSPRDMGSEGEGTGTLGGGTDGASTAPPTPKSSYFCGFAMPDALRWLYVLTSLDILLVQLLSLFGWCVFGRWGCCDHNGCCNGCCASCGGCENEADLDYHQHQMRLVAPPRGVRGPRGPPPLGDLAPEPFSVFSATTSPPPTPWSRKQLQLAPLTVIPSASAGAGAGGGGTPAWPNPYATSSLNEPVHHAFYFEYWLGHTRAERRALTSTRSRPFAFAENFIEVGGRLLICPAWKCLAGAPST